jgi:hypothetical protein
MEERLSLKLKEKHRNVNTVAGNKERKQALILPDQ